MTAEEYIREIRSNRISCKNIAEEILLQHPRICLAQIHNKKSSEEDLKAALPHSILVQNTNCYVKLCQELIKISALNLQLVSENLIDINPASYIKLAYESVTKNTGSIRYISNKLIEANLHDYMNLWRLALAKSPFQIIAIPKLFMKLHLNEYKSLISDAIEHDPTILKHVHIELLTLDLAGYIEIAEIAIKENGMALADVHKLLLSLDENNFWRLCCLAVEVNGLAFRSIPKIFYEKYPEQYKELSLMALVQCGLMLEHMPESLQCNEAFCRAALEQNYSALHFAQLENLEDILNETLASIDTVCVIEESEIKTSMEENYTYQVFAHIKKNQHCILVGENDVRDILIRLTSIDSSREIKLAIIGDHPQVEEMLAGMFMSQIGDLAKEFNIVKIILLGCTTAQSNTLTEEEIYRTNFMQLWEDKWVNYKKNDPHMGDKKINEKINDEFIEMLNNPALSKSEKKKTFPFLRNITIANNEEFLSSQTHSLLQDLLIYLNIHGMHAKEICLKGYTQHVQVDLVNNEILNTNNAVINRTFLNFFYPKNSDNINRKNLKKSHKNQMLNIRNNTFETVAKSIKVNFKK